jgi:hypothetical protein
MAVAQGLTAIIVFWAIVGGLGASLLLLPAMQSLIHGNFQGAAQRQAYALVGAAAAVAAAVGPLIGGFITTYLSWRIAFLLEDVVIAVVLSGIRLIRDVEYTGSRRVDVVGAVLSVVGMGGIVLGILVWQEGGEAVGLLLALGAVSLGLLAWWLVRRKRAGKATLLDPDLFKAKLFRFGVSGQLLQQIALGGTMIALPIYLQIVLEYSAMGAGLSIAPPVVRAGLRRRHLAGGAVHRVHQHGPVQHRAFPGRAAADRADLGARRPGGEQHPAPKAARRAAAEDPGRDHQDQHPGTAHRPPGGPPGSHPRGPGRAGHLVPHDAPARSPAIRLRRTDGLELIRDHARRLALGNRTSDGAAAGRLSDANRHSVHGCSSGPGMITWPYGC